jgi:hypothetical protein
MFSCHYMGSAEFEFGALPRGLKRIRAGRNIGRSPVVIDGHTVYVVGSKAARDAAPDLLREWMAAGCRGQEWAAFPEHLTGEPTWTNVDAWWALGEDFMFALRAAVADDLVTAVSR